MRSHITIIGVLVLVLFLAGPVMAVSGPVIYQGKYYYTVNSADPTEDTGAEVCAKVGTDYIGFTALTTDVCKSFHPSAAVTSGVDGSKAGFYCNGPPQKDKCSRETNTCDICPACNLNVDGTTVISDQYNEMYVECAAPQEAVLSMPETAEPSPDFKPDFFSSLNSAIRLKALGLSLSVLDKEALKKYGEGKVACDFYGAPLGNRFYGYCTAPFAIENFCKKVMGSLDAKKEFCGTDKDGILNGLIICSLPCPASSGRAIPAMTNLHCAYDPARKEVRSGDAPISFCGQSTALPQGPGTGMPAPAAQNTFSAGSTLPRPTIAASGQPATAGVSPTTQAAAATGKLCPTACYLRTTSLGAAGPGYVNCEVSLNNVHKALNSCPGTETQLSIDKNQAPVPCSCPPVEIVSTACPSQCGSASTPCFVDPKVIGKSSLPCGGTIHGTVNMHCTCVLRDGQWKLGSEFQIT